MTNPDVPRSTTRSSSSPGAARASAGPWPSGFAEAGADVVVASRKIEACEEVADEMRALGRRALRGGVPRRRLGRSARRSSTPTVAEFGRIDVLVNNAGIAPVPPSLLGVTEELFDKTIDVNLKGPLRLTALGRGAHAGRAARSSTSAPRRSTNT